MSRVLPQADVLRAKNKVPAFVERYRFLDEILDFKKIKARSSSSFPLNYYWPRLGPNFSCRVHLTIFFSAMIVTIGYDCDFSKHFGLFSLKFECVGKWIFVNSFIRSIMSQMWSQKEGIIQKWRHTHIGQGISDLYADSIVCYIA